MKLHAIHVRNLNSLYGDHHVDLDKDLDSAPLFLVVGPTGAGKSTLMDAVSLALFGTTPRLQGLHGIKNVAEQIMSRGTGDAAASVEFSKWSAALGRRVRYRASWSVQRARKAPEGKMQDVRREFEERLENGIWQITGGGIRQSDIAQAVEQALEGFSLQDFQRAMLLAQGRFDAMLQATADERASILERLTATESYQQIGQRAAKLRSAWTQRLLRLERACDQPVPTEEEIAALRERAAGLSTELSDVDANLQRREAQRAWFASLATADEDVARAKTDLQSAVDALAATIPEQEAYAAHQRCSEAFSNLDAVGERAAAVEAAKTKHAEALTRVTQASAQAAQAASDSQQATEASALANDHLQQLRGPVQVAIVAVERAAERHDEAVRAEAALTRSEATRTDREHAVVTAAAALDTAAAANDLAQAEAAATAPDDAIVAAMTTLQSTATAITTRMDAVARAEAQAAAKTLERADAAAKLATRRRAYEEAAAVAARDHEAPHDAAQRALAAEVGSETAGDAMRDREAALQAAREAEGRARATLPLLRDLAEQRAKLATCEDEAVALADKAAQADADVVASANAAEAALALQRAADDAVRPLAEIAALGSERARLVDGQSCPLCGGLDHPFVDDPEQRAIAERVTTALAEAQARQAVAQATASAAVQQAQNAERTRDVSRTAVDGHARLLQNKREAADQAAARVSEAILAAGLAPSTTEDEAAEAVETRAADVRGRAAAAERLRVAIAAASAAAEALAAERKRLELEENQLREGTQALAQAEAVAEEQRADLDAQRAAIEADRAGLRTTLEGFGVTCEAPETDGVQQAQRRARARTEGKQAAERAAAQLQGASKDHAHAVKELAAAQAAVQQAAGDCDDRRSKSNAARDAAAGAVEALRSVWQQACAQDVAGAENRPQADAPPSDLLRHQEAWTAQLSARALAARQAHTDATNAQAAERGREVEAQQALVGASSALQEAEQVLDAALTTLGLDVETLRATRQTTTQLAQTASRVRGLQEAHAQRTGALRVSEERATRLRHRRPDGLTEATTADEVAAEQAVLQAHRARLEEARNEATATLRIKEADGLRLREAGQRLDRARAEAAVWLQLHDLIGTADGKNFKLFAQSLNLDQLLRRANVHLRRLAPRYSLRNELHEETRLPTLQFVVDDTWQQGTVRSVKTLSGGESFLVSLALALGLADLRTSTMPVETLLLDEGFGTLDGSTLHKAVETLQQLNAEGRQIGIISHVPALQERVDARIIIEPIGEGRSRITTRLTP